MSDGVISIRGRKYRARNIRVDLPVEAAPPPLPDLDALSVDVGISRPIVDGREMSDDEFQALLLKLLADND